MPKIIEKVDFSGVDESTIIKNFLSFRTGENINAGSWYAFEEFIRSDETATIPPFDESFLDPFEALGPDDVIDEFFALQKELQPEIADKLENFRRLQRAGAQLLNGFVDLDVQEMKTHFDIALGNPPKFEDFMPARKEDWVRAMGMVGTHQIVQHGSVDAALDDYFVKNNIQTRDLPTLHNYRLTRMTDWLQAIGVIYADFSKFDEKVFCEKLLKYQEIAETQGRETLEEFALKDETADFPYLESNITMINGRTSSHDLLGNIDTLYRFQKNLQLEIADKLERFHKLHKFGLYAIDKVLTAEVMKGGFALIQGKEAGLAPDVLAELKEELEKIGVVLATVAEKVQKSGAKMEILV
ncbi:hypothetical protein FACS189425_01620 [Clostridia bacterium]|nr:hypothetical protein FACS189425_01620 [Clostridia bacterium]